MNPSNAYTFFSSSQFHHNAKLATAERDPNSMIEPNEQGTKPKKQAIYPVVTPYCKQTDETQETLAIPNKTDLLPQKSCTRKGKEMCITTGTFYCKKD
jgi:hypothetical protein